MDISNYIGELLYEHDCVIIPGFGGFVCNYKPAEIQPILHTISPPSKAISFNKNLRTNDGLLINHIASREQTSFDEAFVSVYAWVGSSNALLQKNEELNLRGIGKLHNNIEGNLIFTPDESVNYLKSSFGLRTITAEPISRMKTIEYTERKVVKETKPITIPKGAWKIAAVILLAVGMGILLQLMRTGVEIKPLHLDEAGVLNLVSSIFKPDEPELNPISSATENITDVPVSNKTTSIPTTATAVPSSSETYYVIVGSFSKKRNVEAAKERLQNKYPGSKIYVEKISRLTRVGFAAGNNYDQAMAQLTTAQREDGSYWLLTK